MNSRNQYRHKYIDYGTADMMEAWIEDTKAPTFMLHLSFGKPINRTEAEYIFRKFTYQVSRHKYCKQHIHWFVYGGLQTKRSKGDNQYYHFHAVACTEYTLDGSQELKMRKCMGKIWKRLGGGSMSIFDKYLYGGGGIRYSMMFHPHSFDFVSCNSRGKCRRKGSCIHKEGIKRN